LRISELFRTLILLGPGCEACPDEVHNVHDVHRLGLADTRSVDFRETRDAGGLAESDTMNDHEGGPADEGGEVPQHPVHAAWLWRCTDEDSGSGRGI
jgi:hypothetical protein